MDAIDFDAEDNQLNRATAARLAKLRNMPLDSSRLDDLIQTKIPVPPKEHRMMPFRWPRPLRALAASVAAIAVLAGLFFSFSSQPVEASMVEMARFHNQLVAGQIPVIRVNSLQDANQVLGARWAESPKMPNMPNDHAMACCMRSVKDRKLACVLFAGDDEPVSMTVANSSDMKTPSSPIVEYNGVEYHVQSVGALNMVMTQRNDRWVCLIAKLPQTKLMDLAASLQF